MSESRPTLKFKTFEEFLTRFPPEETCFAINIMSPDNGGVDYWSITLVFPVNDEMRDCYINTANTHEITKYRNACLRRFKLSTGLLSQ